MTIHFKEGSVDTTYRLYSEKKDGDKKIMIAYIEKLKTKTEFETKSKDNFVEKLHISCVCILNVSNLSFYAFIMNV